MASLPGIEGYLFPSISTRFPSSGFSPSLSFKMQFSCGPSNSRRFSVCAHDSDHGSVGVEASVSGILPKDECSVLAPASAIDFLTLCHNLKSTKRQGWVNHGIERPESIADHMYRMALMTLIVDDLPGVNRERCLKIAIVHDIAEAIVGDITPSDGVPKAEKSRMEREALEEMCKVLGGGTRADEIRELWQEYENNSSLEANLVKDFDKVELILQALEYETEHGKVLDEFFESTAGKIVTEVGRRWAQEITSRRNSGGGKRHASA